MQGSGRCAAALVWCRAKCRARGDVQLSLFAVGLHVFYLFAVGLHVGLQVTVIVPCKLPHKVTRNV